MKRPLAGYLGSEGIKCKSCVPSHRRVMHSPMPLGLAMSEGVRDIGLAIEHLDKARDYVDHEWYIEVRSEMVRTYLDLYYVSRAPYDQAGESA